MKPFWKTVLASFVGMLAAGIILNFLLALFLASSISANLRDMFKEFLPEKVEVESNSIAHLNLNREIKERSSGPRFDFDMSGELTQVRDLGLNQILEVIEEAKENDDIEGIYLEAGTVSAGYATVEEIRNALIDFKNSGKWIISYNELYTQKGYYLSSVSDEIYVFPQGVIEWKGLYSNTMFFTGLLEKLDIEMQIIRGSNNQFKSAVEPFMYKEMSEANRKQKEVYMGAMWNHMLEGIAKERGITIENLNSIADSLKMRTAFDNVSYNFADGTKYYDEVLAILNEKSGNDEDEPKLISTNDLATYIWQEDNDILNKKELAEDNIALVYAIGDIVDGHGSNEVIGSITLSKHIREARLADSIDAVVIRVNSPGGSALASDVIWREVQLTSKEKPVIISMGDVAASGGYYISAGADYIFAQPNTLTGSIGVFGMIPNLGKMAENKLGLTFDKAQTNAMSDFMSLTRPLNEKERKIIQAGVDQIYGDFLMVVANGREMDSLEVDNIGQGRVWSGIDAKEIGLVDEFGGISDAIDYAANKADISDYNIVPYPKTANKFMEIIQKLTEEQATVTMEQSEISSYFTSWIKEIKKLGSLQGYQARVPYIIDIQ